MPIVVVKTLEFDAWAREYSVTETALKRAAEEIEAGLIDARLGGFLVKKRIAAAGRGKRGGYRVILGYRQGDRLIFIHGFAKNEIEAITKRETQALRKLCEIYMQADAEVFGRMIAKKLLLEVGLDEQDT
ncbi:type II toxin-antitoxin system RelE/ParE family toxin [Rhizobium sp. AQ_MP]|uniref:type II toxin-antitoxin system RelE/ParE family toxin n=1 Tax=Rhizobium sp. AQ_MP TaxID=2761536 RepID=UPI001639B15B|nr:type II toxin-antitoxin system RelE/ParE family toxin [Rhizobium sp. AQ_MP]MBC2774374.1 type II toxin-antitoxin system RelE/ParE family toxin [Rhizobium sp. AQ_MP]